MSRDTTDKENMEKSENTIKKESTCQLSEKNCSSCSNKSWPEQSCTDQDEKIILNENLFFLRSNISKPDLEEKLSSYARDPKEDIGIIKMVLANRDNLVFPIYTNKTLIIMKKYIYDNIINAQDEDLINLDNYTIKSKKLENINKTLFIKFPESPGVYNKMCIKKINEVIEIFKRFGILKNNPVIKVLSMRNPDFEPKFGSITLNNEDPTSIECLKLILNGLEVEYEYMKKKRLALIHCKYDDPEYKKKKKSMNTNTNKPNSRQQRK